MTQLTTREGKQTKPMCHEIVIGTFHEVAKALMDDVPELRGLGLVIDWRIGQQDLPCGTVYVREELQDSPTPIFGLIEQTRKMLWEEISAAEKEISKLGQYCETLLRQINGAEKIVEEKEAEIKRLQEKVAAYQSAAAESED